MHSLISPLPFIVFVCVFSIQFTLANILNVPDDFDTIQEAINAAEDEDTVLVSPGTYFENINFESKAIVVASLILITGDEAYIDSTIIDGNENGTVVSFVHQEDRESVLDGFTVTGGNGTTSQRYDYHMGGGVLIYESSPIIRNCIIEDNSTYGQRPNSKGGGKNEKNTLDSNIDAFNCSCVQRYDICRYARRCKPEHKHNRKRYGISGMVVTAYRPERYYRQLSGAFVFRHDR